MEGSRKLCDFNIPSFLTYSASKCFSFQFYCFDFWNPSLIKVVTGCDSSNVAVWELESGNKAIVFSNAHGDEEITCMAFDESYRRLLTGARNGTIKVLKGSKDDLLPLTLET